MNLKDIINKTKYDEATIKQLMKDELHFLPLSLTAEFQETEAIKNFINKLNSTNNAPMQKKNNAPASSTEAEELLKRDIIVITANSIIKSGFVSVMEKAYNLRPFEERTIVFIENILNVIEDELSLETNQGRRQFLTDNSELIKKLRDKNLCTVLPGNLSSEGLILSEYLREYAKNKAVLILGKQETLDTFIYIECTRHKTNDTTKNNSYRLKKNANFSYKHDYVPMEQLSFSASGQLLPMTYEKQPLFGFDKIYFNHSDKRKYTVKLSEKKSSLSVQPPQSCPETGSTVFTIGNEKGGYKKVHIGSLISDQGAEARIYNIEEYPLLCCKIYRKEAYNNPDDIATKLEKIKFLTNNYKALKLRDASSLSRVAYPMQMVYFSSDQSQPVGFIMRKLNGKPLSSISPKNYIDFLKNDKRNAIIAASSMLELVRFLHDNNIIIGDINNGNVLLDDNYTAYIVDIDSCQVISPKPTQITNDGNADFFYFGSSAKTPEFTAPENIGKGNFLYSKASDVWAVQRLLFQLLTLNGCFSIYPNNALSSAGELDIKNGIYLYPKIYQKSRAIQPSDTLFIINCILSRLPEECRIGFYQSFNGNGSHFSEESRFDIRVWHLYILKYYLSFNDIKNTDAEDIAILPKTIRYDEILSEDEALFNAILALNESLTQRMGKK